MKSYKNFYSIFFIAMIISSTFCVLGGISLLNDRNSLNSQELQIIPINPAQFDLSDGMYINHTNTWSMGGSGAGSFYFTRNSNSSFHISWNSLVFGLNEWDVNTQNRAMANITGAGLFTAGDHDPSWIFTNVSLGMTVPIAVIMDGDHNFNVSGELTVPMPGAGLIDVWILEDLDDTGLLWYEKTTGVLINGTFQITFFPSWYSFDFLGSNIVFTPNDYTPELTGGLVTPLTGDQTTQFNFSVVYTDRDNNTPFYVNVLVNGTPNLMEPQNMADVNYTDGCTFQYLTSLQPGLYNYSFECFDGIYSNSTLTYAGINVTAAVNFNPPVLSDGQVTPGIGYNSSTIYFFRVNYSDIDNNPPSYVNVTVNSIPSSMSKEFPSDGNYIDGCWYIFNTTLPTIGTYTYYFNSSDVNYTANLGPLIGPIVQKTQLFNGMYVNHTLTSNILASGPSAFSYSYLGGGIYNVTWVNYAPTWEVNVRDRIISNVAGGLINDGSHTPAWIHNIASLGDTVQIGVFNPLTEADHTFNISAEIDYLLPGFGPLEIWVLEDLTEPGGFAWYEKSTGILLNGTFIINIFGSTFEYTFYFNNTNVNFTYIPCDYAPELTSGTVVPLTGNQTTLFNFSVVYTDQDNNYPLYINTLINGTPYPMQKQNISDVNYTDGCLYQTITYLQPGLYNYSFECGDWNFTNSTPTYTGINVSGTLNLNAPVLSDGQVDPGLGYNSSTIFIFRVNYSDIENNPPLYVNITINTTTSSMYKENLLDNSYIDGCWFTYNTTLPNVMTYDYYFNCSDVNYTASLGPITGPTVKKSQLFTGLSLNHSFTSTILASMDSQISYSYLGGGIYNVMWSGQSWDVNVGDRTISNPVGGWFSPGDHTFAWINNSVAIGDQVPIMVIMENDHIFNISGETSIYFPKYGPIDVWTLNDLTEPGGWAWYDKESGILINGSFIFMSSFSYSFDFTDTNGFINEFAPELTSGSVLPMTGNTITLFNFSVLYTDQDDNPPLTLNALINGTPYPMTPQNPADINYTDGAWYELSTFLQPGLYNYSFECGDWNFTNSTPTYTGINVSGTLNLNAPVLSDGQVDPGFGYNSSTIFIFRVNYSDIENNPPLYVNITINTTTYSMYKENPLDNSYIDGCWYTYNNSLPNVMTYDYYFNCSDVNYTASLGPLTGPTVKKTQLFNGMYSNHSFTSGIMGNALTEFRYSYLGGGNYSVTWTGWGQGWDVNVGDRAISNPLGGWFSPGDHTFAWINNSVAIGDEVPLMVVMENDHIFNISGETSFYSPKFGLIDVWILDDLTEPGGWAWYEKESGILINGSFIFMSSFSYDLDFIDTNGFINDYAPELTSGSILPMTGNTTTSFNFSVLYTDQDDNPPITINVLINGTPYPMTPRNPGDINYTDGAWYDLSTYLQQGLHNYSFECSDWKYSNSTITYFGINVTYVNDYSPNLTNGQVSPSTGWSNTSLFIFTVNYTDADNNGPLYVNVTINGTINSMSQQNPLDTDYRDGAIFEYQTTLNVGTYNYSFDCWDGNYSASDGPYFGPMVQPNVLQNYIMVPDWNYQWDDATLGTRASMDGQIDAAQLFNLPFSFQFYNESYNSIYVCTNGFASFTFNIEWVNTGFPTASDPYMIALFWEDLQADTPCNIFVRNLTSPNRVAIEWQDVDTFMGINVVGTFEIVLFESGEIIFNYDYLNYTSDYTCGLNLGIDTRFYNSFTALNTSMDDFSILFYRTDLIPPNGTQSPSTNTSNLQSGDANGFIWVNGTAADNIRVQNVFVEWANTSGGAGDWSTNLGSNSNWAFNNVSAIDPGYWEVRVNITDLSNNSVIVNCFIYVDATPPSGYQWANTSTPLIQKSSTIWINGTYTDGNGSGIQSITLTQSNTSGGVADWSGNVGTGNNFAYFNTSPLADNQLNGFYEIIVSISDNAGNIGNVTCQVTVEIVPPYGTQDSFTNVSNPQRGSVIWVNGTAFDDGFGVQSVTTNGSDWSINQGTVDSWAFYNNTALSEGIYQLWVNVTDLANNSAIIICQVFIDNVAPSGSQWANTTTPIIQKSPSIWINGTTTDPIPSSGVVGVAVIGSNTSGGFADWSANVGTPQIFAFYNVSPIADNSLGGYYEVNISIIDNAGNQYTLVCQVTVEINPPSGSQDAATQLPTAGDLNGRVWVNGTCSDLGFGMKNVTIQWSNHSGWSTNQGTLNSWAFYNSSAIGGGLWEIQVNVTDLANNSAIILCYVYVDFIAPTGSQDNYTNISSPQNGAPSGYIYVNGTASDGLGIGMQNVILAWTNTSATWSNNLGTNTSWSFRNTSAVSDGIWEIIITLTDQVGNAKNVSCYIFVDTIAPNASQTLAEQAFQTVDLNGYIWVNGTATDFGSGLRAITIQGSNHTGSIWDAGVIFGGPQTISLWGFRNLTSISDGIWEVYVNITDYAWNSINFTAYITVDTSPPSGSQDATTSQAQNGPNGFIWINGTASDGLGIGLLDLSIVGTNHSGSPWSANLGINTSWAFNNISAINDGIWEITVNLIDQLGNTRNITCYVNVDTTAPTGAQDTGTQLPQTTDLNGYIWVNGTATDGVGAGILSVDIVWTNHTGNPWSLNLGTNSSWAFNNLSAILDGVWLITINVTDFLSNSRNITCLILVDNTAPIGLQNPNTNASIYQETAQIWVNGTANDGTGSGILSISVVIGQGNAPNNWSANLGTNSSWAFTNTSAIPVDLTYWIIINIIDLAGNQISLNCTFRVELHPPLGTQDPVSKIPQNAAGGFIWINGTASDGGSGVKNISITYTNSSSTFTNNLGDNSTWLFSNSSSIADGVWEITITIFDNAGHSRNISGIIIVDTLVPSQPTNFIGLYTTGYQVSLSWSAAIDNTTVTYLIYRNSNYIANTTFLNFTDIVPSAGTYIYYVVPVDAAGNMGPQSTNQTVIVSGGPSPSDDLPLIIILIGVGLAAVAVVVIATRRRKRTTRPQVRPRAREAVERPRMPKETVDKKEVTTKDEGKALLEAALREKSRETPKKVDLNFFLIEGEKDLETPDVALEVEDAQTTRAQPATTEVKEALAKPKIVHFTFYCSSCRKWYGLKEFAQVDCPICNEPLKLSYFCPTCGKRYTVKEPKVYNCPRCKTTKLVP